MIHFDNFSIHLQASGVPSDSSTTGQHVHAPASSSLSYGRSRSGSSSTDKARHQGQYIGASSAEDSFLSKLISAVMPANSSAEQVAGIWESLEEWHSIDLLLPILPVSNAAAFSKQQTALLQQRHCLPLEAFTANWPPSSPEPQMCMPQNGSHGLHESRADAQGICSGVHNQSCSCSCQISSRICCKADQEVSRCDGRVCSSNCKSAPKRSPRWHLSAIQGCRSLLRALYQSCLDRLRPLWLALLEWFGWFLLSCARISSLAEPAWMRYFSWLLEGELGPSFRCVQVQQEVAASKQDVALEELWAVLQQPGPVRTFG